MSMVECELCHRKVNSRGLPQHTKRCKKLTPAQRVTALIGGKRPSRGKRKKAEQAASPISASAVQEEKPLEVEVAEFRVSVSYVRDLLALAMKTLSNLGV